MVVSIPKSLLARSSSRRRSVPSPSALPGRVVDEFQCDTMRNCQDEIPIDKQSKCTRHPCRLRDTIVGVKNIHSSSGWAVTISTELRPSMAPISPKFESAWNCFIIGKGDDLYLPAHGCLWSGTEFLALKVLPPSEIKRTQSFS